MTAFSSKGNKDALNTALAHQRSTSTVLQQNHRKVLYGLLILLLITILISPKGTHKAAGSGLAQTDQALLVFTVLDFEAQSGQIYVANADGSDPRVISPEGVYIAMGWSPDGSRLMVMHLDFEAQTLNFYSMNPDGSDLQLLIDPEQLPGDVQFSPPGWSPDGSRLLVVTYDDEDEECKERLFTVEPGGANPQQVADNCSDFTYVEGDLLWSPDGSLFAYELQSAATGPSYVIQTLDGGQTVASGNGGNVAFSPDGTQIAYNAAYDLTHAFDKQQDIFIISLEGGEPVVLVEGETSDRNPAWSPDGTQLVFEREESEEDTNLYLVNADGSDLRQLTDDPLPDVDAAWSPDGTKIAFTRSFGEEMSGVFILDVASGEITQIEVEGAAGAAFWQPIAP